MVSLTENVTYELWRSPTPYFTPDDIIATQLITISTPISTTNLAYTDVIGNSNHDNHYYLLKIVTRIGAFISNEVGKVHFILVTDTN